MILVALAIGVALPIIFLRGRLLAWCIGGEVAIAAILTLASHVVPLGDRYLALAIAGTALVIVTSIAVATGRDVRWSANRAALAASIVYACLIPTMTRVPIDGDEPYYLLVTDSLVHDRDLDLRNQYRDSERLTGRVLQPQPSDPVGRHGEQYSRHEPFLPLLLAPGYAIAGLPGALATIALFAALAVRSTIRLLEDEGIDDAIVRQVFPFLAFAPPLIFFAVRIWPEAPAAFAFVETIRGLRQRQPVRWMTALFALVFLKIRFVLVAVMVAVKTIRGRRNVVLIAVAIALAIAVVWLISGSPINVHSWEELKQFDPRLYLRGIFGLMLDGAGGLLFQAPFYLLGILAIARWRSTPEAFRAGWFYAALYLFLLVPRSEWHGGWSPPLRYVTFFMPVLALGAASIWQRVSRSVVAVIAVVTVAVTIHGIAYPWRLFHIANGENAAGEWLSSALHADFSRLFPSFIRPNAAAIIASILLFAAILSLRPLPRAGEGGRRPGEGLILPLIAVLLVFAYRAGMSPAKRVDFEDAHVIHRGGALYPEMYRVARFNYRGGWLLHAGESVSFRASGGRCTLEYSAPVAATIQIGPAAYQLEATANQYKSAVVEVPRNQRVELRCLSGTINLDRLICD